jgi:hypothetical protein
MTIPSGHQVDYKLVSALMVEFFSFFWDGLDMWPTPASNSWSACISLPSVGITGVCHHAGSCRTIFALFHQQKHPGLYNIRLLVAKIHDNFITAILPSLALYVNITVKELACNIMVSI